MLPIILAADAFVSWLLENILMQYSLVDKSRELKVVHLKKSLCCFSMDAPVIHGSIVSWRWSFEAFFFNNLLRWTLVSIALLWMIMPVIVFYMPDWQLYAVAFTHFILMVCPSCTVCWRCMWNACLSFLFNMAVFQHQINSSDFFSIKCPSHTLG